MGALAELRSRVAAVLQPVPGEFWEVHALPVDSLMPPAYMLSWSDPWIEPSTHCFWSARLDVVTIANRIDVEPGMELLETLVETGLERLAAAGLPAIRAVRHSRFELGGITYLATRLIITHPVSFQEVPNG